MRTAIGSSSRCRQLIRLILLLGVFPGMDVSGQVSGEGRFREKDGGTGDGGNGLPAALVRMQVNALRNGFRAQALPVARKSTVAIVRRGKVVAGGTLLRGPSGERGYLLFPADIGPGPFSAYPRGEMDRCLVLESPPLLLSEDDNLAVAGISGTGRGLSTGERSRGSEVGAFVGVLAVDGEWRFGTVTHGPRSAVRELDPVTRRALAVHWERIGLQVNRKRRGFPLVIETDLPLLPSGAGNPVFDLGGRWHGIAIARVDHHSTFVIPAKRICSLLEDFERKRR